MYDDTLYQWTAAGRVDEAAAGRERQHWLRQQRNESTSLRGVLVDVAERALPVTLACVDDLRFCGEVQTVGADYVALRHGVEGADVVVVGLAWLRTVTGLAGCVDGDRASKLQRTLHEVLVDLAAQRPDVTIRVDGLADPVRGELHAVGSDVVTVAADRAGGARQYVAVPSIVSVAWSD